MISVTEITYPITVEEIKHVIDAREVVNLTVNSTVQYIVVPAGEAINGHKVIYVKDNKAYMASNDNLECLNSIAGISINAVSENGLVRIQTTGELDGFSFAGNGTKYLGLNGNVSDTIFGSVFCAVGVAISATKLLISNQLLTIKRV